jgi:asparagine synthetase B (glutamine-hydrolysing)
MAATPHTLVDFGHDFNLIKAVPRGCVVDVAAGDGGSTHGSIIPSAWSKPGRLLSLEDAAGSIRTILESYMDAVAAAYPRAQLFVCMSGGLDSSGIAALARARFPGAVAVSFDFDRPSNRASQDRAVAKRLAHDFNMPLLEVNVTQSQLFEYMDTVLVEGIDWRDFNVHAGLVNAALAEAIQAALPVPDPAMPALVMTGDLANEFLVDYHPERYRGVTYYQLPRLSAASLRTSLIRGLDTCHREVGVFAAWNLWVVQPYAVATDAYMALGAEFLELEDRKERLCRQIFGDLIPEYVYARPKVRAQVGDPEVDGGVLAACVNRGFDSLWLRQRFARLHAIADLRALDRFVRAGHYRASIPFS